MGLARKSISWVAVDTGGTAVLSFAVMLVVARLVGPEEFGAAALAIGCVQLANIYVEGLLHDALIQRLDVVPSDFDKAFWVAVGIGFAFAGIALGAALLLEGTAVARIAWLTFGMACSLPFCGAVGIGNARLRRDFRYEEVARPSLIGRALGAALGVALAAHGAGAWSLIVQQSGGMVFYAILLYAWMRWLPRPYLPLQSLRPLWRFALPAALMHSLVAGRLQIFLLLVASFSGLVTAGYVNLAFRLTVTPYFLLTTAFYNLGFPFLAKHQRERTALLEAFQRFTRLVALTVPPLFIGLTLCAGDLVPVVLGPGWEPSVPAIELLAGAATIYFMRLSSSVLVRALGNIRYSLANSGMHFALTIGAMILLRPTTVEGAVICWVVPVLPLLPLTVWGVRRAASISPVEQLRALVPPAAHVSVMAGAVLLTQAALAAFSPAARLILASAAGGIVYTALVLALEPVAEPARRFIAARLATPKASTVVSGGARAPRPEKS